MEEVDTKEAAGSSADQTPKSRNEDGKRQRDLSRKRKRETAPHRKRDDKKQDMDRVEYFRSAPKKAKIIEREGDDAKQETVYSNNLFSKEEIEAEERKPKRKVAVLIGYSGSGYKGMQIMPDQKTIEGELFNAFVAAGAISKANADDPKKSSLVRCARTDKGVHAAGNVISLKLIIEDPDIVEKINSALDPQIRVWGIIRTTGGFSCYALCDSRWYEYLIPTYSFLPPHPSSFLAKELERFATEDGKLDELKERQKDVLKFWEDTERDYIKPILDDLKPELRERIEQAMYKTDGLPRVTFRHDVDLFGENDVDFDEQAAIDTAKCDAPVQEETEEQEASESQAGNVPPTISQSENQAIDEENFQSSYTPDPEFDEAIQRIKMAYLKAKKAYRISESRLQKIKDALSKYHGTQNYHNFTIRKSANDPSAKRFIKSFKVNGSPMMIGDSEWLSLKVHGQSFMMHQIRKMVAMAALVVRSGTPLERMDEVMTTAPVNIPKAPGLGLLLERPVFENYNRFKATGDGKEPIDFVKYEEKMLAFKQKHIYDRIFEDEEKEHVFHSFFSQVDNFKENTFLFLSTRGIPARDGPAPDRTADSAVGKKSKDKWNRGRDSPFKRRSKSRSKSPKRGTSPAKQSSSPIKEVKTAAGAEKP